MSVTKALSGSVENIVIDLVLSKGCPVLEEGKENPILLSQKIYARSAWKDAATNTHVKGGAIYDEHTKKWISFDGCQWDFRDAVLTKDSFDAADGKVTFEVEGLICKCGQYSSQKVRYVAPKEDAVKAIAGKLQQAVLSL